ncbi:MAG: porin family protein [Caulobacteraceae bacterium]|nr:porin family protein [Caulobacteraceae bacterium]
MALKAPPPPFTWNGCYVGIDGGGAHGHVRATDTLGGAWLTTPGVTPAEIAAIQANGSPTMDDDGLQGGAQIGCNWQTGPVVFGIEADGSYLGLSNSQFTFTPAAGGGGNVSNAAAESTNALFTIRPRLGFAAQNALFYVTGGFAEGHVTFADTQTYFATTSAASGQLQRWIGGWTVGGGVEYAIISNWIIGAEYLHVDLRSTSFTAPVLPGFATFLDTFSARFTEDIFRARVSYKFDWAPIK